MANSANRLRKFNVVRYKGDLYAVSEAIIRTPPNLSSFVQLVLKNINTGKSIDLHCNIDEPFDVLESDFKTLDYSYEDKGVYYFMDQNTFETYEIHQELIADAKDFISVGKQYEIMFVENQPVRIHLPESIDLKVVETPEFVSKGNTTGRVTKEAKLETGVLIDVPHFIKVGDVIRVNTTEKKYVSRVNE